MKRECVSSLRCQVDLMVEIRSESGEYKFGGPNLKVCVLALRMEIINRPNSSLIHLCSRNLL